MCYWTEAILFSGLIESLNNVALKEFSMRCVERAFAALRPYFDERIDAVRIEMLSREIRALRAIVDGMRDEAALLDSGCRDIDELTRSISPKEECVFGWEFLVMATKKLSSITQGKVDTDSLLWIPGDTYSALAERPLNEYRAANNVSIVGDTRAEVEKTITICRDEIEWQSLQCRKLGGSEIGTSDYLP